MNAASDDVERMEKDENSDTTNLQKVDDSVSAAASMPNAASKLDDDDFQLLKAFAKIKLQSKPLEDTPGLELQETLNKVKKQLEVATAQLENIRAILKIDKPIEPECSPLIEKLSAYVEILQQIVNGNDASESKPI